MSAQCWLMKTEPEEFSIDDLSRKKREVWTGVRNYQARNFMTQEMKTGDEVIIYHSNAEPSGAAGLARVSSSKPIIDPLQFDSKSDYYDPKSPKDNPRWLCVEVEFVAKFKNYVSLEDIKKTAALKDMNLLRKGNRLSIQKVSPSELKKIKDMGL